VWTSGASESNNLAIKGAAEASRGRHLVTVQTEHKAVLDTMKHLGRNGFDVTFLAPKPDGLVDAEALRAALRPDTVLVSVMMVNNEIGVVQDIGALGRICREHGVLFHVDAAQATGKVTIDLSRLPVDLLSLTAHKTYGPKGIGALYVRRAPHVRIAPQMHGGGHENGLRSGTLATHQIVGMGECYRIAGSVMQEELDRIRALRNRLWSALRELPCVRLNGSAGERVPHNLNIGLEVARADALIGSLTDIAFSTSAACSAGSAAPSHVLEALGRPGANAMRLTLGRFTTADEVDFAAAYLRKRIEACGDAGR
jgi:cysteine desulfurase